MYMRHESKHLPAPVLVSLWLAGTQVVCIVASESLEADLGFVFQGSLLLKLLAFYVQGLGAASRNTAPG